MSQKDPLLLIKLGNLYSTRLKITPELMTRFAELSGDFNPLHVDDEYAQDKGFMRRVCYGNILGFLVSTLVGMKLEYEEVMLISQKIQYRNPVYPMDNVELTGEVTGISDAVNVIELKLIFTNQKGEKVASGMCQLRYFK